MTYKGKSDSDSDDDRKSEATWDEAQKCLEKFTSFMESRNEFTTQDVMHQYKLHSRFLSYRRASLKQLTIQQMFKKAAILTPAPARTPTHTLT